MSSQSPCVHREISYLPNYDDQMTGKLERAIIDLLAERGSGSICPSEVARSVGTADGWRSLMPDVRAAASRLAVNGEVEITQGGRPVDLAQVKGPVRIRKPG